jgi:stringent starvation protein B
MISNSSSTSTRSYLIRALHEWCTDNGFTPYITVQVDASTQVPKEHVKNKEIVLNVSFDATSGLKLGNEYIEFKGRFSGIARDIIVPVHRVVAIFARENSQGMAFPMTTPAVVEPEMLAVDAHMPPACVDSSEGLSETLRKVSKLVSVESATPVVSDADEGPDVNPPKPSAGSRPNLKRVK